MKRLLSVLFGLILPIIVFSNYYSFLPYTAKQPDGTQIECFVSGDEYYNWLHDKDGYTIIQGQDGFFYYGIVADEEVVASEYRVNSADPATIGLKKWAKASADRYRQLKSAIADPEQNLTAAPHSGILNNVVIYIRFSDDTAFTTTRLSYDNKFNATGAVSLRSYFSEVSYGALEIVSSHFPVCDLSTNLSYQDTLPRAYYEPYNATTNLIGYQGGDNGTERRLREHGLIKRSFEWIVENYPEISALDLDGDSDGFIDNVCFVVKGGNGAWNALLWAHSWSLYTYTVSLNGKRLYRYTFQPETQCSVQTLCHEMFHAVGAPDLYHYTSNGINPVGNWDLMEYGFGHMGAYMKWRYSNQTWISTIPEITTSGTYTLSPLASSSNNCYKIASPYSSSEYFMVEYRKKTGMYESYLSGSGLIVYRIDTRYSGNAYGPPDGVYIYRPDGTTSVNGSYTQAYFSSESGRTVINDTTNPSSFLQDGSIGGLDISDVTSAGTTISFTVNFYSVFNPASYAVTQTGPNSIELGWQLNSNNDQVLLAVGETAVFGHPQDGETYSPGDTLSGGGVIVYAGSDTSFVHTPLDQGETFYYRIWSQDESISYSQGLTVNATTWCTILSDFPALQSFTKTKLPGCWSNRSKNESQQIWQFGTIEELDTLPLLSGNYAFLNSYAYGSTSSQNADLISPTFDFSNHTNINVSFNHYLLNRSSGIGSFLYSTDYGQSWTPVQQFSTTSAQNPELYSADLTSELAGNSYVLFKFNYVGSNEKYWAIDDFQVNADWAIYDSLSLETGEYGEGTDGCFNAYQSIVVGGSDRGSFELFPYSSTTFIAGSSIRFLPGFHAHESSKMVARITTNNQYCNGGAGSSDQSSVLADQSSPTLSLEQSAQEAENPIRIYPNPCQGKFTVDWSEGTEGGKLFFYNMIGCQISRPVEIHDRSTEIDLRPLGKGVYFVAAVKDNSKQVRKIVIR